MAWRSPHDLPKGTHRKRNALLAAVAFSLLAFVLQIFGAWYSGSVALLGDTAHLFTDLVSLIMSLVAVLLAARPANKIQSFGLFRLEVLAAFLNGLLLLIVGLMLGFESFERLRAPQEVLAVPLLLVSGGGLLLNLLSALVLASAMKGQITHDPHSHGAHDGHEVYHGHSHSHNDRNLSSALLHVMSDALSSVAVMAGAAAVYFTGQYAFDAAIGLILSFVVLYWAFRLLRDTGHVLLEGTPRHINPERVIHKIRSLDPRISQIEDLHIWEITSRMYLATAEVRVQSMTLEEADALRTKMNESLHDAFGIAHFVVAIRPELKLFSLKNP